MPFRLFENRTGKLAEASLSPLGRAIYNLNMTVLNLAEY